MEIRKRVEKFEMALRTRFQSALVTTDEPKRMTGSWFIDVRVEGRAFVIEYRPAIGFGLSSSHGDNENFGTGPDEIFLDEKGLLDRLEELVKSGSQTEPTASKLLQELRTFLGITQAELAQTIGIKQPTISKMERHVGGMSIDTLQRYVRALGGEVRVVADVKGHVFEILAERFDTAASPTVSRG